MAKGPPPSNPNDAARDAILRHLYSIHTKARSPRSTAILVRDLAAALKPQGFRQQQVASNLDYLVQKRWVTEVVDQRSFSTARGTLQSAARRTYKISDIGIDRLESASTFSKTPLSGINVTTIHGVTVVGDGNVVNASFAQLSQALNALSSAALASNELPDAVKLDLVSDIDSIRAQLQKPEPDRTLISRLWTGIQSAASVAGLVESLGHAATLIKSFL